MAVARSLERPYETLFICPSDAAQQAIDALVEKIKAALGQAKGTVRSVQVWGRRRLAYPIKHQKDGLYIYIDFNGESGSAEALKNLFRVTDLVLRYTIVERVDVEPYVRKTPSAEGAPATPQEPVASTPAPSSEKPSPSSH